ncbi:MAG: acetolactate decarboxylase [Sedimentisphaerales bacterium]|nr:acetolactate decarboxylase [Sedimentisphaerales bacterium]
MKKYYIILTLLFAITFTGCTTQNNSQIGKNSGIYQYSTIDALLAGVYDSELSCEVLTDHGNFGIGTFAQLDGEMILLDGKIYQVKADGLVYTPAATINTPFATVCNFTTGREVALPGNINFDQLKQILDSSLPNPNLFQAIRIDGTFSYMHTRSVPMQTKPYPPLAEVAANQPEFEMNNITGTIVGFRCPDYVKGINVPGYHLHFISSDHNRGGHILDFTLQTGNCKALTIANYQLELPTNSEDFNNTNLNLDRSDQLEKVES